MQITFITGNQKKADYLKLWLGVPIEFQKLDLDELQSLDPKVVIEHKVRQAYAILGRPVLVDDVALSFTAMGDGQLPGTFIKYFLESMGEQGLCNLAHSFQRQTAEASMTYALHDGRDIHYFEARQTGLISNKPIGENGFGWNKIFIPDGSDMTYGQMDDATFKQWNIRAHAIKQLRQYLDTVQ